MVASDKSRTGQGSRGMEHRVRRMRDASLKPPLHLEGEGKVKRDFALDCGWGRLIFGQTFELSLIHI